MAQRNRVIDGKKKCPKCLDVFPVEHFGLRSNGNVNSYCPACKNKTRKEWDKANRTYEFNRNANLKKNFGLTIEDYQSMLDSQGGVCKICGKKTDKPLFVDHCHHTNKIRGLLCTHCNTGIGMFFDNPELLRAAIEYLEEASNGAGQSKH